MAARRLFNALQGQTDLYYDVSIVFGTCARTSKHSKYVQSCVMSAEKNAFPDQRVNVMDSANDIAKSCALRKPGVSRRRRARAHLKSYINQDKGGGTASGDGSHTANTSVSIKEWSPEIHTHTHTLPSWRRSESSKSKPLGKAVIQGARRKLWKRALRSDPGSYM